MSTDVICSDDDILAEVLQGFRGNKEYRLAREILLEPPLYQIITAELVLVGADNCRRLRKNGLIARKYVDNWIATFCIENKLPLLFSSRNFIPFVEFLGFKIPQEILIG